MAAKRSEVSPTELHIHLHSGFAMQDRLALKVEVEVQ